MSGTVPAGLRVRAVGWYPVDGAVARLGVGEGASIARAARRLSVGGRPCGPEPQVGGVDPVRTAVVGVVCACVRGHEIDRAARRAGDQYL